MKFFCVKLEITRADQVVNPQSHYRSNDIMTDNLIGKIKNDIDLEQLAISDKIYKNEKFFEFLSSTVIHEFTTVAYFYSPEVREKFNIYGGIYNILEDGKTFKVKILFYNLKESELISKDDIKNFDLIFMQAYFIENNILNMVYHNYRLSLFLQDLNKEKIYNMSYTENGLAKTKLYDYQRHNMSIINDCEKNPTRIRAFVGGNLIYDYGHGITFDHTTKKFIDSKSMEEHYINGGIIMDETGLGKTLQMIYLATDNNDQKTLIIVPDHIKEHWNDQFKQHIIVPLHQLKNISLMSFTEFNLTSSYKEYDRVIVDELHELYKSHPAIFEKIVGMKFKYRWGVTATPFISDDSLFNIMKFCMGKKLLNERIANVPAIQDELVGIFIKNTKQNTKKELNLPPVKIQDIFVDLDHMQKTIYECEKKTQNGTLGLRKLLCDIQLRFGTEAEQTMTPGQLKKVILEKYKLNYEEKLNEYKILSDQMTNLLRMRERLGSDGKIVIDDVEFTRRIETFKVAMERKNEEVVRYKTAYDYYRTNINKIEQVVRREYDQHEASSDETCAICMGTYEPPISYFKKCGHFFCKVCVDEMGKKNHAFELYQQAIRKCPMCRTEHSLGDINIINNVVDIASSSKCLEIISLIGKSKKRFIVFTQFAKLIDNLSLLFERNNITSMNYRGFKNSTNKDAVQVIILSSEENASGIDLSFISDVIIFEPFEDYYYCKEIEKQLIGRCDRIGQKNEVNVYRYICKGTIEEEIYSKF